MVWIEDTLGGGLTHSKILVVDDELMIRKILLRMLKAEPYTLFDASDAEEAIQLFTEHTAIDLLITDLRLPGAMSGSQLAKELVQRQPSMRVIIISGAVPTTMTDLALGTYWTLSKPFTTSEFKALVKLALGT